MARRKKKASLAHRARGLLSRLDKLTHMPGRTKAARKAWAARARAAKRDEKVCRFFAVVEDRHGVVRRRKCFNTRDRAHAAVGPMCDKMNAQARRKRLSRDSAWCKDTSVVPAVNGKWRK